MLTRRARPVGFTLVELLVVITIIGLLIALIVPAVMAAREAARRAECTDHLKQMMLAITSFQSANGYFPPASPGDPESPLTVSRQIAPHVMILPYLELQPVYNAINHSLPSDWGATPENETAQETRIAVFLCPSESSPLLATKPAPNSYRANLGSSPYVWDSDIVQSGGLGAFPMAYTIGPSAFHDGLGQTAFLSERRLGGGNTQVYDPHRDHWCIGLVLKPYPSSDSLIETCSALPPKSDFCSDNGGTWYKNGHSWTWYSHTLAPNSKVPACKISPCPIPELSSNMGGLFCASSEHPGGVHLALGDGSVRFAKESIELRVWRALSTRGGGETVGTYSW